MAGKSPDRDLEEFMPVFTTHRAGEEGDFRTRSTTTTRVTREEEEWAEDDAAAAKAYSQHQMAAWASHLGGTGKQVTKEEMEAKIKAAEQRHAAKKKAQDDKKAPVQTNRVIKPGTPARA